MYNCVLLLCALRGGQQKKSIRSTVDLREASEAVQRLADATCSPSCTVRTLRYQPCSLTRRAATPSSTRSVGLVATCTWHCHRQEAQVTTDQEVLDAFEAHTAELVADNADLMRTVQEMMGSMKTLRASLERARSREEALERKVDELQENVEVMHGVRRCDDVCDCFGV